MSGAIGNSVTNSINAGPGSLHSNAAYLPVTHQPPHDPRRLPLNATVGWRLAQAVDVVADACGHLQLPLKPGARRALTEASGSLGGLQLPKYLAYAGDYGLVLLDKNNALLKKFDPCDCRFVSVPFTGGTGAKPREFNQPQAVAVCGDTLLVADTGNRRLAVYSLLGFLLRGFWSPPAGALAQLWVPVDVAVSRDRKALVADPANGCVHVFNFAGRWLKAIKGVGAVSAIGVDNANRLYVIIDATLPVTMYQLETGKRLGEAALAELATEFTAPPLQIDAKGLFDLGPLCALYKTGSTAGAPAAWFDAGGNKVAATPVLEKKYMTKGSVYSQALDSRLYRCRWDRVSLQVAVPRGARIKVSTFSAETELTDKQIQALDDSQWLTRQWIYPPDSGSGKDGSGVGFEWDCLIRSAPGRFLWLKLDLVGDALDTPKICTMVLDFPRISLTRYLPAVFSEESQAADFTSRFLEVFDRGFRQLETRIDTMAALFDPLSAPASAGKKDFLSWLASWIGVTLDRQLPLAMRRRLVKYAGRLYQCRGTLTGLRHVLDLYLGFGARRCAPQPNCRPCADQPQGPWSYGQGPAPQLILEHYVLRRWLFVGYGRLGDQAVLWGQKIVNRSQLRGSLGEGNAQLGVTQLNTRQDPLRDPFHEYAHKFSVFLPAWVGRLDSYRKSINRLIAAEKPAHTQHRIVYVEPRFRVGIQSMIGYDSVIGCYPQGVTLRDEKGGESCAGSTVLGRGSVLSGQDYADPGFRIGTDSTIGSTARLS